MSAFEPHVVAVEWVGINSLSGTMNEISGGMTNLSRQQQMLGRQGGQAFSYWSQQANIARRSFEYMIAGMGAYKVIQAFQNYKQFRSELGTLNANLQVGQNALNAWGQQAIAVSNRTTTPLNQIVESFQNLAASFPELSQQAKAHLFPVMAEIEAKASNILSGSGSTVQPQQFGSTVLQAARSFYGVQRVTRSVANNPRGRNILEQTASQVLTALMRSPGTSGSQLVSYLPTLLGAARASQFSIPEAMAMFNVAQRVGGRPSQTIQYLRQFMLRLRRPTTQEQPYFQQALSSRGMDINKIGDYSGWQIMMALLQHAASLPGGVTPKQIRQMMRQGNTQGVNLSGQAAQFLQNAIGGRIQSLVAVTQLSTGLGDLNKEVDTYKKHLVDVNSAYDKWQRQNQLQTASNQLSNFSTSIINSFNPLINMVARAGGDVAKFGVTVLGYGQKLMGWANTHTGGVAGTTVHGAEAFGLAYALRAGMPPGIGNALGRIPGIGRFLKPLFSMTGRERSIWGRIFGRGAATAGEAGTIAEEDIAANSGIMRGLGRTIGGPLDIRAISSALTGMANGTPSAPFWVVIHPLSRITVPEMFGLKPSKGLTGFTSKAEQIAKSPEAKIAEGYGARVAQKAGVPALRRIGTRLAGRFGARALPEFGSGWLDTGLMSRFGGTLAAGTTGNVAALIAASLIWPSPAGVGQRTGTISIGDYTRRIKRGGGLDQYMRASRGNIPAGVLGILTQFSSRRISESRATKDIQNYFTRNLRQGLTEQMTRRQASAFYKYVDPIFNLGNKTTFIHRAMQQGGYAGYADLTVEVEPTQELKNLIKAPNRKVHVRVPIASTPPTSRGGRPTKRSR